MFKPKHWFPNCKEAPYRVAWEGEVITVPRSEAVGMYQAGLIKNFDSCRDSGPGRIAVKVEAFAWHFKKIGAPVIVKEDGDQWSITCRAWNCSFPSKNPLKSLNELWNEMMDSAGIDLTPIDY
jgi:hypothetical protein